MEDFVIKNPRLESIVSTLVDEFIRDYKVSRCYEISRHLSSRLQQQGFPKPQVRDGIAIYNMDFLMGLCLNEDVQDVLSKNKKKFSHLFLDHSWCELAEENVRIDYLPSIMLPEGTFGFNRLLLIDVTKQNDKAEYFPISKEFKFGNSSFIYTPTAGPKIGPFHLPKIIKSISCPNSSAPSAASP